MDAELRRRLPAASGPSPELHRAMRYAALGPGKRVRPALVVLSHDTLGGCSEGVWAAAAAVEMAHAFSLVHDDLPCMDDDDLRRGRPTAHRRFGEAMALLAGDALLAASFETLSTAGGRAEGAVRERSLHELAEALGASGMIAGQALDMRAERRRSTAALVRRIHRLKTSALLRASVRIGALWAGASERRVDRMGELGEMLGMAFQARDDLLNATSDRASLGKAAGSDEARRKATLVRALGVPRARAELGRWCDRARERARRLPAWRSTWEELIDFMQARGR